MTNDNETVEQVYAEAMETTGVFPSRQTYAKRYLAAHKRELAAKDMTIVETNAQLENLRILLGALLKKASPRCEKCEDVCDVCDCSYAAAVPIIKDAIEGVAIYKSDIDYMPLVKFAKNKDALEAKDAEIASLMGDMEKLLKNGDLLCVQKVKMERELEKRNALIKELNDKLWSLLPVGCRDDEACYHCKAARCDRRDDWMALVAKAREVVK